MSTGVWVATVPFRYALQMVEAVNNSRTEQDRRDAFMRLRGYKKHCDQLGHERPCEALNKHFQKGNSSPVRCGVYLDWKPSEAT